MTIPSGAGRQNDHPEQRTNVPEDAETGLPAASGISGGEQTAPEDIQAGGPVTDSITDPANDAAAAEVPQDGRTDPSGG